MRSRYCTVEVNYRQTRSRGLSASESKHVADRLSSNQGVVVQPRWFGHQLRNTVNELFNLKIHFKLQCHLRIHQICKYLERVHF